MKLAALSCVLLIAVSAQNVFDGANNDWQDFEFGTAVNGGGIYKLDGDEFIDPTGVPTIKAHGHSTHGHSTHSPTKHGHTTHKPTTHARHTTHAHPTHKATTHHAHHTTHAHTTRKPTTHARHTTHAHTTHKPTTHAHTTHHHKHTTAHPPTVKPTSREHECKKELRHCIKTTSFWFRWRCTWKYKKCLWKLCPVKPCYDHLGKCMHRARSMKEKYYCFKDWKKCMKHHGCPRYSYM